MKIKDITTILNKLEEAGWGDTEIYTEWEEDENGYTGKPPEFHLYFNGINEAEFKAIFPHNPFVNNAEVHSFGISKEMYIHEKNCKLSNSFNLWKRMQEGIEKYYEESEEE